MTENDLVEMALKATGMTRETWDRLNVTMQSDADMNKVMREEWHASPRASEEAIREYYRKSDIWFVNTFCHGKGALLNLGNKSASNLLQWHKEFIQILPGTYVLDYGGGFFNDTWQLIQNGEMVTQAEVEGPVTTFLKAFIEKTSLSSIARVLEVKSAAPIIASYDGITCFETLEHVLDPVGLAKHLVDHLRPGGPFAMSVSFGAPEHAPYHVASNAPLSDPKVWEGHLVSMGLEKVWAAQDSHRTIWRKK